VKPKKFPRSNFRKGDELKTSGNQGKQEIQEKRTGAGSGEVLIQKICSEVAAFALEAKLER